MPTRREYYEKRLKALADERNDWEAEWKDISAFIAPRRGRYETTDRANNGLDRYKKIINSRGSMAARTLASGLMSGLTSPARAWFELGTPDPDLMRYEPVREWLRRLSKIIYQVYASSNFYQVLPTVYLELGLFGTACMSHVDDFNDIARFYGHTAGRYYLAQNDRLVTDVLVRQIRMTVGQMAKRFGYERLSQSARNSIDQGNLQHYKDVVHFIEPNEDRNLQSPMARDLPFSSIWYEVGSREDQFLLQSGFHEQPFYAPRWEVTEGDTYGTSCPGMVALGDVKALQILEKEKATAIQKKNNPPLKGPSSLANKPIASIPGGTTLYDGDASRDGLQPIYQVNPDLRETEESIRAHEYRIDEAFFADLFRQLHNLEGVQPRNQLELTQRNEEKLLMLGPLLESVEGEFLDPNIDRVASQIFRAGIMPEPPEELVGQRLKITYISPLAVAQKQVATGTVERLLNFVLGTAQADPQAVDVFNSDEAIREYESIIGAPPRIVRSPDEVMNIREQRAKQQQMAEALEVAQGAASAAKDVGLSLAEQT